VAEVDAIRWISLSDDEVVHLRQAVAQVSMSLPGLVAAYHYGSSARRRPARDIDIGLVAEHTARSMIDVDAIVTRIAERTNRPRDDFDVRVVNDADAVFMGNLMREGKLCYERDRDARVAFEVRAMNAWLDFQPVWERLRRRTLEVWSRG
jgi:predicted nucleotidyltransferase